MLLTDNAAASVACARENAARNGLGDVARSALLEWSDLATAPTTAPMEGARKGSMESMEASRAEGARAACEAAGIGRPWKVVEGIGSCAGGRGSGSSDVGGGGGDGGGGGGGGGWLPDLILAADCCYSDAMGDAIIGALGHLLTISPPHAKAILVIGWPNRCRVSLIAADCR